MTEGQALDYFNAALKHGSLCAGTNYMIDRDETVWECMVWAGGGIWYVKPTKRENTKEYHELRRYAAIQRRTIFEARTETPNVEHNRRTAASSPGVRVDGPVGPLGEE